MKDMWYYIIWTDHVGHVQMDQHKTFDKAQEAAAYAANTRKIMPHKIQILYGHLIEKEVTYNVRLVRPE